MDAAFAQAAPSYPTLGSGGADAATAAPPTKVSLTDAILMDHSNALLLCTKLSAAAAQGNAHALELLAAALAMHLRFYCQGLLDTLGPLLRQWLGKRGEGLAAAMQRQVEALELSVLELLTLRRERDWLELARRAEVTRQELAEHVPFIQGELLPPLAAHMHQEELGAACRSYLQRKQAAPLAPHTGTAEAQGGPALKGGLGQGREAGEPGHSVAEQ